MTSKTLKRKPLVQVEGFSFDPIAHAYTLNGKPMIGVTSVLRVIGKGDVLVNWAANMACDFLDGFIKEVAEHADWPVMFESGRWAEIVKEARVAHRKKKEAAGTAGTDVHAEIERLIKYAIEATHGVIGPKDHLHPQVAQFLTWASENKVKFLASEQRLYSESLWYAGTADFICEKDGKRYVGDVKTSSAIYPEHFIQASAYANALVEQDMYTKFDGVIIVNVPKKGGLNVKENYDLEGNFECFKAALTLHKYLALHA